MKTKKTPGKKNAVDNEQRMIIAWRIQDERKKKFPGFGGRKKCCEELGVSQSIWSHWEHGNRTPDEEKLKSIADFFGVTVEHMKTAPKNWPNIYRDMIRLSQLKQKRAAPEDNDDEDDETRDATTSPPVEQTALEQNTVLTAKNTAANGSPKAMDRVKLNISQMLQLDEMHDRGEIPTPLFNFAMETISEHLKNLFNKSASPETEK